MKCIDLKPSKVSKTIFLLVVFLLIQYFIPGLAPAQHTLSELRDFWENERYSEVAPLLIEYRYNEPYGKNLEVDYMIATSACRTPQLQEEGYQFFRWILYYYSLHEDSRQLVEEEMLQCSTSPEPKHIDFTNFWSTWGAAGVKGKTYYWLGSEDAPIANEPVEIVENIPLEEFKRRLFEVNHPYAGAEFIGELVGPGFKIESFGHFIIASASDHSQNELLEIGNALEKYFSFFISHYNMPPPTHLITMYLIPSTYNLQDLSKRIHGIKISEASIGYSFRDDLSIVAVIPRNLYGTLAHELFHLLVRNNFGDIPPWLDEGIAALYEVSKIEGDKIIGLPNWRGRVIEHYHDLRPSIAKLASMDWKSFDNAEGDYEASQQATNHATARYFMLYLQDIDRLVEVYNAFRNRRVTNELSDPGLYSIALLEQVLTKPILKIDQDFTQWLDRQN